MLLFWCPFDLFIAVKSQKNLFVGVHINVLPLRGDRWTDATQLRTVHLLASGSAGSCRLWLGATRSRFYSRSIHVVIFRSKFPTQYYTFTLFELINISHDVHDDCGGPEPARNSVPDRHLQSGTEDRTVDSPEPEAEDSPEPEAEDSPEPEAEDSLEPEAEDNDDVCSEIKEPQSSLNSQKNIEVPVSGVGCGTDKEQFTSSDCDERSSKNSKLRIRKRIKTGEKPFSCCDCGKRFNYQCHLDRHRKIHTGEKPFREKTFIFSECGEKPFSCWKCGKRFIQQQHLIRHTKIHTGEKPFSCGECGKRFIHKKDLITHTWIHTGEKPFSCGECGKRFIRKQFDPPPRLSPIPLLYFRFLLEYSLLSFWIHTGTLHNPVVPHHLQKKVIIFRRKRNHRGPVLPSDWSHCVIAAGLHQLLRRDS
uniref:C2H2-type domain-containing protein n=1 Tax=Sparus aurata TaxID=8175 RepID=A0A671U9R8_SPAAU